MRRACAWLALGVAPCLADPAEVALEVDPLSASTITVSIGAGEAVATMSHWGTLQAEIDFEPLTAAPQTIRFTGGIFHYSDGESIFEATDGSSTDRLYFTRTGMSGYPETIVEAGSVDPSTGLLDNSQHVQHLNAGTLEIEYGFALGGGFLIPVFYEIIDYGETPESTGFGGTTRILAETVATGILRDRLALTLIHETQSEPVEEDLGDPDAEEPVIMTTSGSGGFTALGELEVPSTGLRQWLVDGGAEVDFSDPDAGAARYAMGLDSPMDPLPVSVEPGLVRLTLPPGGTLLPLRAWQSADLEDWQELTWPGGGVLLPAGASGEHELVLPAGGRRFVRFEAVE